MTLPITPERLRAHVVRLAGEIGDRNVFRPAALAAAADYIVGQWRGFGYRVARQEFQARGVSCANLEVERPGREPAGGILLIGAHYDSVRGCPAANDNGSGVAALLELARRFAEVEPARTVRFAAFANEEPPFFMTHQQGSIVYARAARQRGDVIRLMASLETMGYFSDAAGSQRYPPLFRHFYPDRGNFSGWCRTSTRVRPCCDWPRRFAQPPISRSSTRRPFAGSRGLPGATIARSGARAIRRS
jgi:hypothetical protein